MSQSQGSNQIGSGVSFRAARSHCVRGFVLLNFGTRATSSRVLFGIYDSTATTTIGIVPIL